LPEDPALAATAEALRDTGQWADIVDQQWRWVYSTDDQRRIYGGLLGLAEVALGSHYFGPGAMRVRLGWRSGPNTPELTRELFGAFGGLVLTDTPGGREELSGLVDPALRELVGGLEPAVDAPARATDCMAWEHRGAAGQRAHLRHPDPRRARSARGHRAHFQAGGGHGGGADGRVGGRPAPLRADADAG
jgi:hypothetical protein